MRASLLKKFFGKRNIYHVSAPGRLDVMGGIADYSGSYVLQMPLCERTDVYMALRNDGILRAYSYTADEAHLNDEVQINLNEIIPKKSKNIYADVNKVLTGDPKNAWAAYVFGCVICLNQECGAAIQGMDFWIDTRVPIGKGVSSSAALEVAVMSGLCQLHKIKLTGNQLPVLAQKVENLIVGAPCGLMDQLATYFGRKEKLLPILCQPDTVFPAIDIPRGINFSGVSSGERHSVGGSSYTDVRTAAFMGYTIIAKQLGVSLQQIEKTKQAGRKGHLPFGGYLAQILPSQFERDFVPLLPESLSGAEFIKNYGNTIDPITAPIAQKTYLVRTCTAHPVYEHHRVKNFGLLLQLLNTPALPKPLCEDAYQQLGEFMYQSHASYSRCGLGSDATDDLVQRAKKAGPENSIYGAKITGGGSGGTVCFLCIGKKGVATVKQIAQDHAKAYRGELTVFNDSSDGAYWNKAERIFIK